MMGWMDVHEIRRLAKELLELSLDFKLVQTTKTSILKISELSTDRPTGYETVVEYTIKRK